MLPTQELGSEHSYDQRAELPEKSHIPTPDDQHMRQQGETARQDYSYLRPSASQTRNHNPHITDTASGKRECLMVDLKQLYVGDEEFSIEEIRSKHIRYSSAVSMSTKVSETWKRHGMYLLLACRYVRCGGVLNTL